MKAYHYSTTGSLTLDEVNLPEPDPSEVRVRMKAASVNYRDLLISAAAGRGEVKNRIPLSDGAGIVDTVGKGVQRWQPGARVTMSHLRDWQTGPFRPAYISSGLGGLATDGVLADFIVMPEASLVAIPDELSFDEAACFPCAAVTAWNGLVVRAGMKANDTLLVQGTGGVALFGLQIGVAMGVKAIVLSSSDEKLEKAKTMGASVLINYRQKPDWDVSVMEATQNSGATHILELGGPDTYDRSVRSVATGGTIVQVGVLSGVDPAPHLRRLMWENANIMGVTVGPAEHLATVMAFFKQHSLRPVIDATFAFEDAQQALERLRSGSHFGKIVIRW